MAVGYAPWAMVTSKTCLSIYYYVRGYLLVDLLMMNCYVEDRTWLAILADLRSSMLVGRGVL